MEPVTIAQRLSIAQRQMLADARRRFDGRLALTMPVSTLKVLTKYELVTVEGDAGDASLTELGGSVADVLLEGVKDFTANKWGVTIEPSAA